MTVAALHAVLAASAEAVDGPTPALRRRDLAAMFGVCMRTVTRWTNELRDGAWITKPAPTGRPIAYTVEHPPTPTPICPPADPQPVTRVSAVDAPVRSTSTPHPAPASHPWRRRPRTWLDQVKAAQAARSTPRLALLYPLDAAPFVGAYDYAYLPVDLDPP